MSECTCGRAERQAAISNGGVIGHLPECREFAASYAVRVDSFESLREELSVAQRRASIAEDAYRTRETEWRRDALVRGLLEAGVRVALEALCDESIPAGKAIAAATRALAEAAKQAGVPAP